MNKKPCLRYTQWIPAVLLAIIVTACGTASTPTPDAVGTLASVYLQQTITALDVTKQALSASQTEAARPTVTPTPIPSPTTTPGPLMIQDDFSSDVGRWKDCTNCRITNGMLYMGPYPVSDSAKGYITLCSDCGIVQDYKMSVDATYWQGYSDRGFGLVLREQNGSYVDLEITTWQVYGMWFFDATKGNGWNAWYALIPKGWKPTGYLHPARLGNHIDVETTTKDGKSSAIVRINGQVVNTVEIPSVPGRVGLVVGLHSLGVTFDNFYFEGYPLHPNTPNTNSG